MEGGTTSGLSLVYQYSSEEVQKEHVEDSTYFSYFLNTSIIKHDVTLLLCLCLCLFIVAPMACPTKKAVTRKTKLYQTNPTSTNTLRIITIITGI